jgi:2-iminobutanoate/2-iminopropanoate deaminase
MRKILPLLCLSALSSQAFALKQGIYTDTAPEPIGVYSQAIKSGNTVYISGQIPIDPATGNIVGGSFKDQVRQTLKNVNNVAVSAGGNIDDIVKVTVYLPNLNNFNAVNEIMQESFHKPYPARAVIQVSALPKNAAVEIETVMQIDH